MTKGGKKTCWKINNTHMQERDSGLIQEKKESVSSHQNIPVARLSLWWLSCHLIVNTPQRLPHRWNFIDATSHNVSLLTCTSVTSHQYSNAPNWSHQVKVFCFRCVKPNTSTQILTRQNFTEGELFKTCLYRNKIIWLLCKKKNTVKLKWFCF